MKINECNLCGSCLLCPYLKKYGYPKEIYLKKDPSVFICTNCGLCDRLCPFDIEPSTALYSLKEELIKRGDLPQKVSLAINSARAFAKKNSRFPVKHIDTKEVVFFPGCSLVSMGPKIVLGVKKWLEKKLNSNIGLAIHCCGDPMYQNGDTIHLYDFVNKLKSKFDDYGITRIITACSNCKKIFKKYLTDFDTLHLTELIDVNELSLSENFILHHPCPNFKNLEVKESIDKNLREKAYKIIESPFCCGLGGSANKLDKDVAKGFLSRIKDEFGNKEIITSCMGCKNRFLKNDIKSRHIYEILTGLEIKHTANNVRKSINRLFVSIRTKMNPIKLFVFLLILLGTFYVYHLQKSGVITTKRVFEIVGEYKYLAPLIYLLIYSIGPSVFFPSLVLTIVSGMLWGPLWGTVFAISGATIGASIPFLLSRYIFHDYVKKVFGVHRWQKLKVLVEKNGWKVVAFTRIVPIFPFPVLNYLFGITPVPFYQYVVTSFLFMLPACVAYVYFGSSIFELILKGNLYPLIIAIIIISFFMILPLILKKRLIPKNTQR